MTAWWMMSLAQAVCGPSGCTPKDAAAAEVSAVGMVAKLDQERPAEVALATFALG